MRLFAASVFAIAFGTAETYSIGPAPGNRLALEVEKTGFLSGKKHVFEWRRYSGSLVFDPVKPEASKVEILIEAASAECKDTWVSAKDLKKITEFAFNEMMDVRQHPAVSFVSTNVTPKGADQFEVSGNLNFRGIAKPVVLTVTRRGASGGGSVFDGRATIKHSDYGLKPSKAALGTIGTKDAMTVLFTIAVN
jgi:polyisoprenoid-binding protein YceI